MDLSNPTPTEAIGICAALFALAALGLAATDIRAAWRHFGMSRIKHIKTVAAPDDAGEPATFPDHAADIETILAAHKPEPVGDLDRWCIANWQKLPAWVRERCVDHLAMVIGKAIERVFHERVMGDGRRPGAKPLKPRRPLAVVVEQAVDVGAGDASVG